MTAMATGTSLRYLDHGVERHAYVNKPSNETASGEVAVLASSSSLSVREYEDKLKAIDLYSKGVEKAVVAERLGRSARWVQKWWRHEPQLLPRPPGAQNAVFQRTPLSGFRDLELVRDLVQDQDMFDILVREVPWRQGKVMTRDNVTGELVLRFDRQGNTIPASRLVADCPKGIASLDRVLQLVFAKANIRDPQARVVLNLYENGLKTLNSHRHDYWTCLVSFGSPRVLLVDNKPHVMEDGDMITFGTQMHGVPAMPDSGNGRISLVIFFYPDRDNLERRWLTVTDDVERPNEEDLGEVNGTNEPPDGTTLYNCDIRTGSASSSTVPGASELAALGSALDGTSLRDRPYWRKSNAELQFLEYPKLPPVTIYSIGCGNSSMPSFLKCLVRHGVEMLWDLRPPSSVKAAVRDGSCGGYFFAETLREACRGCFRCYREWSIGTSAAGGLSKHLFSTEEGATLVYRLCQEAQRSKICFLGIAPDWRSDDLRQSVGCALTRAGATVVHLSLVADSGSQPAEQQQEIQPHDFELPVRLCPTSSKNQRQKPLLRESAPDTPLLSEATQSSASDACIACRRWTRHPETAVVAQIDDDGVPLSMQLDRAASGALCASESVPQTCDRVLRSRWQRSAKCR